MLVSSPHIPHQLDHGEDHVKHGINSKSQQG
jgi:hypothetical protein